MKEKEKKDARKLRQKQRRALGLQYDWLLPAVKWLVCSFPETGALVLVTQGELDPTFRTYGVRYDAHTHLPLVNALGNAPSSSTSAAATAAAGECNVAPSTLVDAIPPAKVIWRCEPCSAYVKHTANHSSHQLTHADKLVTGRMHSEMYENNIISKHAETELHTTAVKWVEQKAKDAANGERTKQTTMKDHLTPEDELQNNYILGVLWLVVFQVAICLIGPLIDLGRAWGVSMPKVMSSYQTLEIIDAAYEYFRRCQRWRMRRVRVYSPLGDGSTDISTTEQECVGMRICWGGVSRNEFVGLEALDLKDGRDGKSPDAQCLSKCYDRQFGDLLDAGSPEIGPEGATVPAVAPVDHWLHRSVSCSFDGASVNTGELTGVISLWTLIAPWILLVHGIAHVVELACSAAYDSIPYFLSTVNKTLTETVAAYHCSGKKQWNAVRISAVLQEKRWYKLCSFSKTRWQRSLTNAIKSVLNDWRVICVHQHSLAHEQCCTTKEQKRLCLSLESPLADFVGRYYMAKFDGHAGCVATC